MSDTQPPAGDSGRLYRMSPVSEEQEERSASLPTPPKTLRWAVWGMYLGALLGVIGIVQTLLRRGAFERQMAEQSQRQGQSLTPEQLHALASTTFIFTVVLSVIFIVVWLFMALMNRQGRQWARITATVLGALNILSLLGSLVGGTAMGALGGSLGGGQLALSVVNLLLAVAIVVLLWVGPTGEWFARMSDHRSAGTAAGS